MTTQTPSLYDHLIPSVCDAETTTHLQMILGSVMPPHAAKLIMHVVCRAEEIGIARGKNMRTRR